MSLYSLLSLIVGHLMHSCFCCFRLPYNNRAIDFVHLDEPRWVLLMLALDQSDLFERNCFGVDPGV
jgi:hypothetical protein